jgi:hypothetical protein
MAVQVQHDVGGGDLDAVLALLLAEEIGFKVVGAWLIDAVFGRFAALHRVHGDP